MRIIIEGADYSGKSTLVEKLRRKYHVDLIHVNATDPNTFEFHKSMIQKTDLISECGFITGIIQSDISSGKKTLNTRKFEKLVDIVNDTNAKVVVLTAPYETIVERVKEKGLEEESLKNWKEIDEKYRYYAGLAKVPVVDVTETTFEQFCNLYIENKDFIKLKKK